MFGWKYKSFCIDTKDELCSGLSYCTYVALYRLVFSWIEGDSEIAHNFSDIVHSKVMFSSFQLIGASCGTHGPYTFYKAFKYNKSGKQNILALNEFVFIKLWSDSDLVSIGELQQLWVDKNSEQTLASLRLYILPENTPEGRTDIHGEVSTRSVTTFDYIAFSVNSRFIRGLDVIVCKVM